MRINGFESDKELLQELGKRIRKRRISLGLTQEELANKSGVSLRTIVNAEKGLDIKLSILLCILRAENLLVNIESLIPESSIRHYNSFKLKKERERIRKKNNVERNFKWGDEE